MNASTAAAITSDMPITHSYFFVIIKLPQPECSGACRRGHNKVRREMELEQFQKWFWRGRATSNLSRSKPQSVILP
jgi:hypothetical protein